MRRSPGLAVTYVISVVLAALVIYASTGCVSYEDRYAPITAKQHELLLATCANEGGTSVDVGSVEVQSGTYPCEILRTYAAVEATHGRGIIMGTLPRFFLRMRLVTKGIFSAIFGIVGLG